jgi:hypothetical protein
MDGVTITSSDHGDHGTYHAHVEGSRLLGRLEWTRRNNVLVVEHTVVPPEIGGRGIASLLLDKVIADARVGGLLVDPRCSFAEAKFGQHPEWADLRA